MRKIFIALTAIAILSTAALLFGPSPTFTATLIPAIRGPEGATIGETFRGEEFHYRLGFWILKDVAEAKINIKAHADGGYIAVLDARTTGYVHSLFLSRHDIYTARIFEVDGGRRFVTTSLEKDVTIGGRKRRTTTWVDYEEGMMRWKSWKEGRLRKSGEMKLEPDKRYDGPLTTFYNLRYGAYGPMTIGIDYKIDTLPKDDLTPVNIDITFATNEDLKKYTRGKRDKGFLAYVKVAKEFFDSKSGKIEIVFDEEMRPVEAVARDVLLFGDIRGRLIGIGRELNFEKSP